MDVIRTHPDSQPVPEEFFDGTVWADQIAIAKPPSAVAAYSVHFNPGARTAWHQHPHGQILHVTEGVGRVQERGGSVQSIRSGDTVVTGAGEWHWHGAAPESFMTHLMIIEVKENQAEEWGEHVTEEEYLAPPAPEAAD